MVRNQEKTPLQVAYERRNPDLDPQLIWRGKDLLDDSPLVVNAPPLYIQEKIHPKVLIDDLKRRTKKGEEDSKQIDLFSAFNGLPTEEAKTEFYQHDQNWSNRMILGDSLQVMASLAEREGLRGKIQCIYFDPPYGIKFNSNFQWSTSRRDVKDGKIDQITREPEQVKAFRDTWQDGIHSYMSYLRDRLVIGRELLNKTGSIFLQIGNENVHRARALLDEIFGEKNFVADIIVQTTTSSSSAYIDNVNDHILWYAHTYEHLKYRPLATDKEALDSSSQLYRHVRLANGKVFRSTTPDHFPESLDPKVFRISEITSQTNASTTQYEATFQGATYKSGKRQWCTPKAGMERLIKACRVTKSGQSLAYIRMLDDYPIVPLRNIWTDTGTGSFTDQKVYVVQTASKSISRCILMASDPGDLCLDPTCGSGTTAAVSEQWGRRWITIDTSRVALALARARLMGARFPYFILADSSEGQQKKAEQNNTIPTNEATSLKIRQGFIYEHVPHITLKSIANTTEIDAIWEKWQPILETIREKLNNELGQAWEEWEVPWEKSTNWSSSSQSTHSQWWEARIARQAEIDTSIASKADCEYLYDKPFEDKRRVRVAGPFTVESLSPHRTMIVNDDDSLVDPHKQGATTEGATDFAQMILDTLRVAGVQQARKTESVLNPLMVGLVATSWKGCLPRCWGHP